MTSFTAKPSMRRPLTDKNNLNMKIGKDILGSKETNTAANFLPLPTPVKKSGRIRKKKVLLDENVYEVSSKIRASDNKVKRIQIKRDFAPNKKELFVEAIQVPNNENIVTDQICLKKDTETVSRIDITCPKSKSTLTHVNDNIIAAKEKDHVNINLDDGIGILKAKEAFCTKQLIVKIPQITEKGYKVCSEGISKKNGIGTLKAKDAFCTKELIVEIPQIPEKGHKVCSEGFSKKDGIETLKAKDAFCTKELIVEIPQIPEIGQKVCSEGISKKDGIGTLKAKEAFCTKELIVEIPQIPEIGHKVCSERISKKERTRIRSVSLNEPLYQIDKNIEKVFKRKPKVSKYPEVNKYPNKSKKEQKSSMVSNSRKMVTAIEKNSKIKNRTTRKKSICHNETKPIGNSETITNENNRIDSEVDVTKNTMETHSIDLIGTKELFIQITPILDCGNINTQSRRNRRKSVLFHESHHIDNMANPLESRSAPEANNYTEEINVTKATHNKVARILTAVENSMETKTRNAVGAKELFIEITQMPNNNQEAREKSTQNEEGSLKSDHVNPEKPVKNVKFNSELTEATESHNLRRLEPKNYAEESVIEPISNTEKSDSLHEILLQKKDHVPIYRKNVLDEPKGNKQNDDLYEFDDVSPKPKKIIKKVKLRKSSILFDKNTVEILQKIEEKEAKTKKKYDKKKKISKPACKQTYSKKMERIMSNVKQKMLKNNETNTDLISTEKISQNTLNNNLKGQKNVPSNGSHNKKVQGNRFIQVPLNQNESVPQQESKSLGNITARKGKNAQLISSNNNGELNKVKEKVLISAIPETLFDSITVSSGSGNKVTQDRETKVPLNDSHSKTVQVNNFNDETSIIVHRPAEVSLNKNKQLPPRQNCAKNVENITLRRERNLVFPSQENKAGNKGNMTDTFDRLKKTVQPKPLDDISISEYDNVSIESDINSCFGFGDDIPPVISTHNKVTARGAVNVLGNVTVRHVESPIDFSVRRPNANSTMIHIENRNRSSSPWRSDWINVRPNPHFVSVKGNALPRIDQEPVLEHTLVEGFENLCSKTPKKGTPAKKKPRQQSILAFVSSNIEIENEPFQASLYDYEAFNSPIKNTRKAKENARVDSVKKNLLGNNDNIVSSTPVQRKVLGDISNSSGEQIFTNSSPEGDSYFGFHETSLSEKTPEKHRKNKHSSNRETDNAIKPSRFDLSALKSYSAKNRKKKKVSFEKEEGIQIPDSTISLVEISNEESDGEEVRLFEEPEEMLDNFSPIHLTKKKRRKRLDSCDSDTDDHEKKRKRRHKKTQFEIEAENWMEQFKEMCDDVDKHELELE